MLHAGSDAGPAVMRRRLRPERERSPGTLSTVLWAPARPTAALLRALSRRLELGWRLNRAARPDLLVLTNLGRQDPAALIARCRPRQAALCLDDRLGREALERVGVPCLTYSEGRDEADLTARDLRLRPEGLSFLAVTRAEMARACVPPGELYAALAALTGAWALGVPLADAARALTGLYQDARSAPL